MTQRAFIVLALLSVPLGAVAQIPVTPPPAKAQPAPKAPAKGWKVVPPPAAPKAHTPKPAKVYSHDPVYYVPGVVYPVPAPPSPMTPQAPPAIPTPHAAPAPMTPHAPPAIPTPHATPAPMTPHAPPALYAPKAYAPKPGKIDSYDGMYYVPGVSGLHMPRVTQYYQGDPADSLFRAAHSYFTRQEYRSAADRFSTVRSRHPNSRYFCDAAYFEAFSRYRLGTLQDLRTGYTVLEGIDSRCTNVRSNQDVPELMARINGALARNGDAAAAERVRRAASEGQNVCDTEERNVKIEALSTLAGIDAAATIPVLRRVLNTKDECSAPIRRQAIALVARTNDAESVSLLGQVARTDPNRETKLEALRALGRMTTDAAYAALEEFFRSSTDERTQAEAASALASSNNPRAQTAVRALLERKDVAERIRVSVVNALSSRSDLISAEYWRALYGRVESDELRRAVLAAISRNNTEESQQFLLSIARNQNESHEARLAALSRIRGTAPINDLYRLLENADSRSMRMSIVSGLAARKEPEATDRLIEVMKRGTDPEVRNAALRALRQEPRIKDPKVIRALQELAGGTL